jgi:hypothetical protein
MYQPVNIWRAVGEAGRAARAAALQQGAPLVNPLHSTWASLPQCVVAGTPNERMAGAGQGRGLEADEVVGAVVVAATGGGGRPLAAAPPWACAPGRRVRPEELQPCCGFAVLCARTGASSPAF